MEERQPLPQGLGTDPELRGNLLGPEIRRDLADLNQQFLELSLIEALEEDPRFAHADAIRASLAACPQEARQRLALCPFSLFQLCLPELAGPGVGWGDRVADARLSPPLDPGVAARCHSFVLLSLTVARQLAGAAPPLPRIALGVTAGVESRLAAMCPSELATIATWPGLVRPRWPRHERVWGMLVAAARASDPGLLQRAHLAGLCLLATGRAAGEGHVPAGRRRGRPVRGGSGPRVPC